MKKSTILLIAEQIYIMEAGILDSAIEFEQGEEHKFLYDLNCSDWEILRRKYEIGRYAVGNSEFEKAVSLMNEFAPRLFHMSDYDNHVEIRALPLLAYSLDNKDKGINCRAKAQIFNEMCLALGIYARKVWLMPYSKYDSECHCVNEIWDMTLKKWIMLDISNNDYWIDESGVPLSILEIRNNGAKRIFCTPIMPNEKASDPKNLRKRYLDNFVYIMKNMAYFEYLDCYSAGEGGSVCTLCPNLKHLTDSRKISEKSVLLPPM